MTGQRHIVHLGEPSVIHAFQAAMPEVIQDLRPDALGFPRDDRVHMLGDLVQAHGRMDAAHDDGHSETAQVSGHFIGAVRLRSKSGNAHQVPPRHSPVVRHAEVLVHDRDFPLRRGQARQNHKAERLPHAVTVPAALLDFDDADKRVGGIDQI
jgi:hypothetical protein